MIFVVETENAIVKQVIPFMNSPGVNALELATNLAKLMCQQNGIEFEGDISCDGSTHSYSIQIIEQC
jgi:hypothetical protein